MKSLIPILLASIITSSALATAQYPDKIMYEGKEYSLHTNPMEAYFKKHPDKKPQEGVMSTALWRGYVATFVITNQVMQLKNVEIQIHVEKEKGEYPYEWKSVITDIVPQNKTLTVDWFTGILVLPYGELVNYVHMGYGSTYSNYILIEVKKGEVTGKRDLNHKEYEQFRNKQFEAFKKTDEYKKTIKDMDEKGYDSDQHDDFLRSFIIKYTSEFLD